MSFGICQLNGALEHASLTQLICEYLEVAVWRQPRQWRWVGSYCTGAALWISRLSSRAGADMMDSSWLGEVQSMLGLLWCPKALSRKKTFQPTGQTRPPPSLIYSFSLGDVLTAGSCTELRWTGYCCLELNQWRTAPRSTGLTPHAENWAMNDIKEAEVGRQRRKTTDTHMRKRGNSTKAGCQKWQVSCHDSRARWNLSQGCKYLHYRWFIVQLVVYWNVSIFSEQVFTIHWYILLCFPQNLNIIKVFFIYFSKVCTLYMYSVFIMCEVK